MVRKTLFIVILGGIILGPFFVGNVLAYGVETHAFLTKEVVNFYNSHFPNNPVSGDLELYLIDGSRHEDTTPRFLNHFYDPVNDRGLADGIYRGQKSKKWAQDEGKQKSILYRAFALSGDTLLTANQFDKIKPFFNQTNFTWQKAIDLYAQGEKEKALFALGHVIHLIEDSAVPDHTWIA